MPDNGQNTRIFKLRGYEDEIEMFKPHHDDGTIHPVSMLADLAMEKISGLLTCQPDTGDAVQIGLDKGFCYGALKVGQPQEEAMMQKLVDPVGLDPETVKHALAQSKGQGTIGFIKVLLGMGKITPQQITDVIRAIRKEILDRVIGIISGKAELNPNARLPIPKDPVKIDVIKYVNEYLMALLKTHYYRELAQNLQDYTGLYPTVTGTLKQSYHDALFTEAERKALRDLDGSISLRDYFARANLSKHDAARLITRMLFLKFLEFNKTPVSDASIRKTEEELDRMVVILSDANYFDRLGVHWTAHVSEIEKAFQKRIRDWGPKSKLRKISDKTNKFCDQLFAYAQEAYAILSDTEKRRDYRNQIVEKRKQIDGADFLYQQAQISLFRGDMDAAKRQIECALDIMNKPIYRKFYKKLGGVGY